MAKTTTIPAIQNVHANLSLRMDNSSSTATPADASNGGVGANDAFLKSLRLASTDSTDRLVQLYFQYGGAGTDMLVGTVNVKAGAGTDGVTPAVDFMNAGVTVGFLLDSYGNRTEWLPALTKIKLMPVSTITAAKFIYATGSVGDF